MVVDPSEPMNAIRKQIKGEGTAVSTKMEIELPKTIPVCLNKANNNFKLSTEAVEPGKHKILACGLGGGLDIVNASLVYFAAQNEGNVCNLGSTRPVGHSQMDSYTPFFECGSVISSSTVIKAKGR